MKTLSLVVVHLTLFASPLTVSFAAAPVASQNGNVIDVWLGTSRRKPSEGIYHCSLNTDNGKLSDPELAAEISGPGFLAMHPKLPTLYAVGSLEGKNCVAAYSIDGATGRQKLTFLNSAEIGDGGAAHVSVDATGKTLLTAQYGGGSTGVFLSLTHI